jgi:hypothetical protein
LRLVAQESQFAEKSYLRKRSDALEQVIAWLMSLMVSVAPPGRKLYIPEAQETVEEATSRYVDIAKDATYVVWDPREKPIFKGSRGRERTATVLLAVVMFESAFRKDVDFGVGKMSRGDGGKSWCLNQVNLGQATSEGGTPNRIVVTIGGGFKITDHQDEGWSGQDLVDDRQKCFHAALSILRSSFSACAKNPIEERLTQYASGHCDQGEEASRIRMGLALRWMGRRLPTFRDADVAGWIFDEQNQTKTEAPILVSQNEVLDLTHLPPLTN